MKHHKQVPDHDPAEDYNEWIRNRYNPGYYLGGRISPLMRASQRLFTGTEKRVGAVLLLACFVLAVAAFVWRLLR